MDNFNPSKKYLLPLIKVNGIADPVFQVVDESNGEVVFTVRKMKSKSFQPFALKTGTYTVRVGDGTTVTKTFKGLNASLVNAEKLTM